MQRWNLPRALVALSVALTSLFAACGDDDDESSPQDSAVAGESGAGAGGISGSLSDAGGAGAAAGSDSSGSPVYVLQVAIFDVNFDRTVYFHLSDSLDLDPNLDITKDRGFPGVADFRPVGGRLLISSGEKPTITEYNIEEDLAWTEGRTVSFADYPLDDNANFFAQFQVDDHTMYLPYEVTSRIIWDPTDMTITKTLEDTQVQHTNSDGLMAWGSGNRAGIKFNGPVRYAFDYFDSNFNAGPETLVAIYDENTHAETSIVTLPCPALSTATQDEEGYTYYSTWEFQGVRALFNDGPNPCMARLKPDLTLDQDWTTDLRDITDGHYVNNLRYLANGMAVGNVLYHEKITADWTAGYDQDVADMINSDGDHWKIWLFDLKNHTGKPLEGIDSKVGPKSEAAVVDGRSFVLVGYNNWGRSRIYEITEEQKAVQVLDTVGYALTIRRLR